MSATPTIVPQSGGNSFEACLKTSNINGIRADIIRGGEAPPPYLSQEADASPKDVRSASQVSNQRTEITTIDDQGPTKPETLSCHQGGKISIGTPKHRNSNLRRHTKKKHPEICQQWVTDQSNKTSPRAEPYIQSSGTVPSIGVQSSPMCSPVSVESSNGGIDCLGSLAGQRHSESRSLEKKLRSKQHIVTEKEDDHEYTPRSQIAKSAMQLPSSVPSPLIQPPDRRARAGRDALQEIIDAAVTKSKEIGNEKIGLAIKKVFEESLTNRTLAGLLDAVVSRKPTPRQVTDFQTYIKEACRQLKSSISKPTLKSLSREQSTSRTSPIASTRAERHVISANQFQQHNGRMSITNDDDSQPPIKKLKCFGSMSSTPSQSSTQSTQSQDLDPDTIMTASAPALLVPPRGQPTSGPRVYTFSHKGPRLNVSRNKREYRGRIARATRSNKNHPNSPDEAEALELATKKRALQKSFDDVVVEESEMRDAPCPVPPSRAARPSFPPQKVSVAAREEKEEARSLLSPSSSLFVMPSTSRAATLDTLGKTKRLCRRGENSDSCSTRGGNGKPQPPESEWLCLYCQWKNDPKPQPTGGMFAALKHALAKRNPDSFELPLAIKEYFDGVKTGEGGEYEELTIVKNKSRSTAGYDGTHTDTIKLRDLKNNVVLCFRCGRSSLGRREIISCDYCTLHWHLDCLDPPMANPPVKGAQGRRKYSWMCPAHVDQELVTLDHSGRIHKLRRPKNMKLEHTLLSRGLKNNGNIEIENELTGSENDMDVDNPVVWRVPERVVKLDFIDRVKREKGEFARQHAVVELARFEAQQREATFALEQQRAFNTRSFADQEAALNLGHFARRNQDIALSVDHVQSLVNTLVMEAPDKVVAMYAAEDAAKFAHPSGTSVPPTPPISDT